MGAVKYANEQIFDSRIGRLMKRHYETSNPCHKRVKINFTPVIVLQGGGGKLLYLFKMR